MSKRYDNCRRIGHSNSSQKYVCFQQGDTPIILQTPIQIVLGCVCELTHRRFYANSFNVGFDDIP